MNQGIAFAADNWTMGDKGWQYDSEKPKLTVDPTQLPPHLQLFELDGGTQWAINPGDDKTEIRSQIEHHMPFQPMFLCYFYTEDAPAAFAGNIGQYALNEGLMRYNGATWFEELYTQVDSKYFYIKHRVLYSGFGGADTSYGSQYKFRVRLEIIARKAVYTGGSLIG
jgi:hypothetical protein